MSGDPRSPVPGAWMKLVSLDHAHRGGLRAARRAAAPRESGRMECPTILIADDDAHHRMALRVRLSAMGFRVVESSDGLGAVGKCHTQRVSAVILDHEMPMGDGRSIAANIRECTDAPILFLSGHDREAFRNTVTRIPDTYYLQKPLDEQRFVEWLTAVVGGETCPCFPIAATA